MELFRALGVRVKGLDSLTGSGCIFQTKEKKYVLTAQHCLTEDTKKRSITKGEISKLTITNFKENTLEIVDVYIPQQESLDFAVIEVIDFNEYPEVLVSIPKVGTDYKFFGFPYYLADDVNPGDSLEGHISDIVGDDLILQHAQGALSDVDKDAKDNTGGFSGSGIYSEEGGKYFLIGILTSLRGSGEHGKLKGIDISRINKFLHDKDLPVLIPSKLNDFDLYFSNILLQEDEQNAVILKKVYKDNFKGLSPYYLKELLNEKITIPYDKNFNSLNEEIWEGWIRLLLYISLYTGKFITKENLKDYIYLSKESESKNILFYTEESKVQKFIRNLYEHAYDDICNEGIVFVNSKDIRLNGTIDSKRLKNIVKSIDSTVTIFFDRGIDITNPNESKNVAVVPLSYILAEIEKVLLDCTMERKNIFEIEKICIEKIKNMFEEFVGLVKLEGEYAINRV